MSSTSCVVIFQGMFTSQSKYVRDTVASGENGAIFCKRSTSFSAASLAAGGRRSF